MMERVHINLSLFAGLIITVASIILEMPFQIFTIRLTVTLCVFYLIGCLLRIYLKNKIFVVKNIYFMEDDDSPNPLPIDEVEQSEDDELNEQILA